MKRIYLQIYKATIIMQTVSGIHRDAMVQELLPLLNLLVQLQVQGLQNVLVKLAV